MYILLYSVYYVPRQFEKKKENTSFDSSKSFRWINWIVKIWMFKYPHLERRANSTINEEIDGWIDHHEHPGHEVQFVERHVGYVLNALLNAKDNLLGVGNFVSAAKDPEKTEIGIFFPISIERKAEIGSTSCK